MSDNEVDLNAMIQSDRRRKHIEKQRKRQQNYRNNRNEHRRDRNNDQRGWHDDRRNRREESPRRNQRARSIVVENYAIHVEGLISDISIDDILKLTRGKKIINIKTSLSKSDGQPIQLGTDNNMSVIINFVDKKQADEFIKQYSDKKIDGRSLQFQFRRGMLTRKPQPSKQQNIEQSPQQEQN